jgi:hypothetical protein
MCFGGEGRRGVREGREGGGRTQGHLASGRSLLLEEGGEVEVGFAFAKSCFAVCVGKDARDFFEGVGVGLL